MTRNMKLPLAMVVTMGVMLADASEAFAYRYLVCQIGNQTQTIRWRGRSEVTFRAGENSYATQARRDALEAAIRRWNQAPDTLDFDVSYGHSITLPSLNTRSEIYYSTNELLLDGAPAVAIAVRLCNIFDPGEIIAYDILFNNDVDWMNYRKRTLSSAYDGPYRTVRTTAIHELGHAKGLKHENGTMNVMGSDRTHVHANGERLRAYVGEDAGQGAVVLYGEDANDRRDVAVSHRKYGGKNGEYSSHRGCRVYNEDGEILSNSWSEEFSVRFYRVRPAQTVLAQFTYENNGRKDEEVAKVDYFISTNTRITTSDRKIASGQVTVRRNRVYTSRRRLRIPDDLSPGRMYFIGAYIDPDNAIPEVTAVNNATYLAIWVRN